LSKYKRLSALEFGYEMLTWDSKGTYPLEAVTSIKAEDAKGIFFVPAIQNYVTGQTMITGHSEGYESREKLMTCIGKCWDEAEQDVIRKVNEAAQG